MSSRSPRGVRAPVRPGARVQPAGHRRGPAPPSAGRRSAGCEDPATAIRRADAFAFAVSQKGVEDGTFWSAKASDYLRGYFCAAALTGQDLRRSPPGVSGADPQVPEQILAAAGAHQWALTPRSGRCGVNSGPDARARGAGLRLLSVYLAVGAVVRL